MDIWMDKDIVWVRVAYDVDLIESLRAIGQGKWDPEQKLWFFPKAKLSQCLALQAQLRRATPDVARKESEKYKKVKQRGYESLSENGTQLTRMMHYMKQAGYSPQTIKVYTSHVRRFLEYSEHRTEEQWINAYMIELLEAKKCSHAYCNQAINAIKLYLKHIGVHESNIIKLVRPKKEKKLPKVLSKNEVKRIFEATKNVKHLTALMLGYSCGMRVSEVANLKVGDIHFERGVIMIKQGKGRKDRRVPLSLKMKVQIEQYMIQYRPAVWFFENPSRDGAIHARTLQTIFNVACEKAGIVHYATFHSLRHSYATHLLESGVDIRIIQELLGHASTKTTEIYTHISNVTIENIINPLDDM